MNLMRGLLLLGALVPAAPGESQEPLPEGAVLRLGSTRFRHHNRVVSLDFSPDGKTLLSADTSFALYLWDAGTGRLIRRIMSDPPLACYQASFLADGKAFAAAGSLGVTIFDVETGEAIRSMAGREPADRSRSGHWGALAIHEDGRRVTHLGGYARRIHTWDVRTGETVQEIDADRAHSRIGVVALPDGRVIAAGGGEILIWGGDEEPTRLAVPDVSTLIGMPDGKTLAVGATPHVILLDTTSGETLRTWEAQKEHLRGIACSRDGGRIATLGAEDIIRVWDADKGALVMKTEVPLLGLPPGPRGIAFSPDGKRVAAALGSTVSLWDVEGGPVFDEPGHLGGIATLAFSPDGKRIVSGAADGTARVWNVETGEEEKVISGHGGGVRSISFSPDMRHLATTALTDRGRATTLRIWDLETDGDPVAVHRVDDRFSECRYTPDGDRVVAVFETEAIVLGGTSGERIASCSVPRHRRGQCAISPDGLAAAIYASLAPRGRSEVQLVDLTSGGALAGLPHEDHPPAMGLTFSPDGRILVTAQHEHIRFWEVSTGNAIASTREVQKSNFPEAAFSPDGHTVALRCSPGGVDLFDLDASRIRHTIPLPSGTACVLATSPDGRRLATGMSDTTILLWSLPETGPVGRAAPGEIEGDTLLRAWGRLADPEGGEGHQAIVRLASAGDEAVAFLEGKLLTWPRADADEARKHVADLDADDFEKREAAARALRALGPGVEAVLRESLEGSPTPETRTRILSILGPLTTWYLPEGGDGLRRLRSIQVLERIASRASARLLETIGQQSPSLRERRAARGALRRVKLRIP